MGRTYLIVYNNGISGHNPNISAQVQNNSDNVIGTFEEKAVEGGVDTNYSSLYWLYINKVNEKDFKGRPIPLGLYNQKIKSLKFEIRKNEKLLADGINELSTGIGFFYKTADGSVQQISQNKTIDVSTDAYSLYYGKPETTLGSLSADKPSRTQVVYNPFIDNYVVRFDCKSSSKSGH